ncbi:MAG: hypothetical protein JSW62_04490 [Thermoplasmatales archaeon]|nr:MAG: hypothetical protein JSW62_04490 [Thermoplasmatales archaeon]
MKKIIVILGAFSIVFLMFSTATAVPQTQNELIIKRLDKIDDLETPLPNQACSLFTILVNIIVNTIFAISNIVAIVGPFFLFFCGLIESLGWWDFSWLEIE